MKTILLPKAISLLIVVVNFLLPPEASGDQRSDVIRRSQERGTIRRNVQIGKKLSEDKVKALEQRLAITPKYLQIRIQLLAYYGDFRQIENTSRRQKFQNHVLWLIKNQPEVAVLGSPYSQLNPHFDADAYRQAKDEWLKQIAAHPKNTAILGNAIEQLSMFDKETGIKLTEKAASIEPLNPIWPQKLGELYKRQMLRKGSPTRELAAKSAGAFERALKRATNRAQEAYILQSLATTTFAAEQLESAKHYATRLLEEPDRAPHLSGSAHVGHTILGRLAIKNGELETAKSHLLDSVTSEGSHELSHSRISMSLAQDLLLQEEWDIVMEYLQVCEGYWKSPRELNKLAAWKTAVAAKQIPNFGPYTHR